MGKKYRENLQTIRAARHIHSLMVIDDTRLRRDLFKEPAKILRKIERLEAAIAAFYSSDQRLFNEWLELTFRADREEIDRRTSEFRKLGEFHNEIVAAAEMLNISMPAAFRMLKLEQEQYARGNDEERARIDGLRAERQRYAMAEMAKEFERESDPYNMPFDDDKDEESTDFSDASANRGSPLTESEREELAAIVQLSDKKVRHITGDEEAGPHPQ
jgi:hypothetical protein